jgi:16S rRNA (guanine966-N2)-methyltransferase
LKYNHVRIIGGSFRGRKISFPDTLELRPTPDRVKETVFNWLAPYIRDSLCLDLFAGSGALSFEAVSRGALKVTALEYNPVVVAALKAEALHLKTNNLDIIQTDTLQFLKTKPTAFDIIFVDPPYKADRLFPCFTLLKNNGWLKPDALIYYEADHPVPAEQLPDWEILKEKRAGNVYYYLACNK